MKRLLCIGLALSSLLAHPALADWQYTQWGMSPADVAARSSGQVHETAGTDGQTLPALPSLKVGAEGTYQLGKMTFHAVFYFENAKLKMVNMTLVDPNTSEDAINLKNALDGLYGEPFHQKRTSFASMSTYQDRAKNNRISLSAYDTGLTTLVYEPLVDETSGGL